MSKYIVLFEVKPTEEGKALYLEHAAKLKPLVESVEGFLGMERFQSLIDTGKVLSVNMWESEAAMTHWRTMTEHRMSQFMGKTKLFDSYKITIVSVMDEEIISTV